MNLNLSLLHPYPFEKLAELKAEVIPPADIAPISLGIGEPRHPAPAFVQQVMADNLARLANYPTTSGKPQLRQAIADWATRRFHLKEGTLRPDANVVPVNGTR